MRIPLLAMLLALMTTIVACGVASGVEPEEQLKDRALESRARDISAGLRCMVCQNQSIDDFDAPLARDLRLLVRQQLQKGESNGQVINYIVARYGEFVLLKPRLNGETLFLWLTPIGLIGLGVLLVSRLMRNLDSIPKAPPLTADETQELEYLMSPDNGKSKQL